MTLTDVRLLSLNHELLRMRAQIGDIRNVIRTCAIGVNTPGIHDRALLQMTSQLHPKLAALGPRLKEISAQVPELSFKTHRSGNTSTHGALGNLRGTLPLLERELDGLQRELRTVHGQVLTLMNDPKRTPSPPGGGLGEMIDMTLELITMVLQRIKQSRN